MTTTSIPTRTELVRRASAMIPTLQEHASWNEQHRRLHDETLQALEVAQPVEPDGSDVYHPRRGTSARRRPSSHGGA